MSYGYERKFDGLTPELPDRAIKTLNGYHRNWWTDIYRNTPGTD